MTVILTGWYEDDQGKFTMIDETGSNLNEIVSRLQKQDGDFGHTDMEFELHFPDGTIKLVEDTIARMVSES
jgi:hypothetical protein